MTLHIERCETRKDLIGLSMLCSDHAAYEQLDFNEADFENRLATALFRPDASAFLWTARRDGQPIGYASAGIQFSTLLATHVLHLDCLFVTADARSAGVGLALIQQPAALARSLGIQRMEWQTPAWNRRATQFYARLGATSLAKRRFAVTVATLSPS